MNSARLCVKAQNFKVLIWFSHQGQGLFFGIYYISRDGSILINNYKHLTFVFLSMESIMSQSQIVLENAVAEKRKTGPPPSNCRL